MIAAVLRERRATVGAAAFLLCLHQACEAAVPLLVGVIVDEAIGPADGGALALGLGALALVFVVLSYSYRTGARIGERAELIAGHELRLRVAERVLDPRAGVEGRLSGDLTAVAGADATKVGSLVSLIGYALAALAGGLVGAIFLLGRSPLLGGVVLGGLVLMLLAVERLGRPLAQRIEREQDAAGTAGAVAADLIVGLRPLKGIGGERAASARYDDASHAAREASVRSARSEAAYEGAVALVTAVLLALVALLGGRMAAEGEISLGELIAALGLTQYLIGPLSQFGWIGSEFSAIRASSQRLAAVLGAPPAVLGGEGEPAAGSPGGLAVREVGEGPLRKVDFAVAPGTMLGVACADPAEAAVLVDLLARERDPATGAIELDGEPLTALEPAALRDAILVAEHDAVLFEGTLRETLETPDGDAAVEPALAAAAADEVVESVPGGFDGAVGARGRTLSGGQRQRLVLARALAAGSPVLVLHEPTTAVDAASEAGIAARLPGIRDGRTTVVLTTSPALLGVAAEVVYVDGGEVVDRGPHRALLERHPRYRELVLA